MGEIKRNSSEDLSPVDVRLARAMIRSALGLEMMELPEEQASDSPQPPSEQ